MATRFFLSGAGGIFALAIVLLLLAGVGWRLSDSRVVPTPAAPKPEAAGASPPPKRAAPPATDIFRHAQSIATDAAPSSDDAAKIAARGALLRALPTAQVVLDAPKNAMVGEHVEVDLRLGLHVTEDALTGGAQPDRQKIPGQAQVSAQVEATLDGPGLTIVERTPRRQDVADGGPTVWRWDVSAADAGRKTLTASIYALVGADGAKTPQLARTYAQDLEVTVKPLSLVDQLTLWTHELDAFKAFLVSLAAVATLLLGWMRWRKADQKG